MKYIITKDNEVIIFSNSLTHIQVQQQLSYVICKEMKGAGFVTVHDSGEVNCYGESVSLKIKSRGDEDAEIVGRQIRGYI